MGDSVKNKRPSVNWYADNYLGGTLLFSYDEKGRYMELLCTQQLIYPAHIPADKFDAICGGSALVREKFERDENGDYYNNRMAGELEKAYNISEQRTEAVKSRWAKHKARDTNSNTKKDTKKDTKTLQTEYEYEYENDIDFEVSSDAEVDVDVKGTDVESDGRDSASVNKRGRGAGVSHKHGEYGWVLLTDKEYDRLLKQYGEAELRAMIECVDGTAERTENKAGYKRWYAVIDNCAKYGWHKRRRNESEDERRARIEAERKARVEEIAQRVYQDELKRKQEAGEL